MWKLFFAYSHDLTAIHGCGKVIDVSLVFRVFSAFILLQIVHVTYNIEISPTWTSWAIRCKEVFEQEICHQAPSVSQPGTIWESLRG
jgi:hypothetical protein